MDSQVNVQSTNDLLGVEDLDVFEIAYDFFVRATYTLAVIDEMLHLLALSTDGRTDQRLTEIRLKALVAERWWI